MNEREVGTVVDHNSGEGWYEFHKMPAATTHIAYVQANGEVYLPEEGWADLSHADWLAAAVKGRVHKLVRASGLL